MIRAKDIRRVIARRSFLAKRNTEHYGTGLGKSQRLDNALYWTVTVTCAVCSIVPEAPATVTV